MYRDDCYRSIRSTSKFNAIIATLGERHPALAGFADAPALIAALHEPEGDADTKDAKDAALVALLDAYQGSRDSAVYGVLLAALFPMLDQLYINRLRSSARRTGRAKDEAWSEIMLAFGDTLAHYPLARRPARVAANLRGETLKRLARSERDEVREQETRTTLADELSGLEDSLGVDSPEGGEGLLSWNTLFAAKAKRAAASVVEVADALGKIGEHVAAGTISEAEGTVLRGLVVGRSIADLARELGITVAALRQRSSRATRALRR